MLKPSTDPPHRALIDQPRWRSLLASYAVLAAIPIVMWMVANPFAGLGSVAGVIGAFLIGKRVVRLVKCFYECEAITFELGNEAEIIVMQHRPNELD